MAGVQNAGLALLAVLTVGLVAAAVTDGGRNASGANPKTLPTFTVKTTTSPPFLTRPTAGPLKAVFAGDSLTYGLYASSEDKGYRPLVVKALSKNGKVEATRGGQTGNQVKTVGDSITFARELLAALD